MAAVPSTVAPSPAEGLRRSPPPTLVLLGLPFHATTLAEAAEDCLEAAACRDGFPRYMVTPNVDFATLAEHDAHLREIVYSAWRSVADGMPVVWVSRLFGRRLPERVAGSDLVHLLFQGAAQRGLSVYFFGSDPATLERAATLLREKHPGLKIVGLEAPPMAPMEQWDNAAVVGRIRAAAPNLLLLALGCPKQERWIYAHGRAANVPLSLGIGASLDFIAGKQTRAPRWMQQTGLEWLWRLLDNPSRLGARYTRDFAGLFRLTLRQWRWQKSLRRRPPATAVPATTGSAPTPSPAPLRAAAKAPLGPEVIEWSGEVTAGSVRSLPQPSSEATAIVCNCERVTFMDSSGLGALVALARRARTEGLALAVVQPAPAVLKLLQAMKLDVFMTLCPTLPEALATVARQQAGQGSLRPGEAPTLHLPERLDAAGCALVRQQAIDLLKLASPKTGLALAGEQVRQCGPEALSLLLELRQWVQQRGGELRLPNPSPELNLWLNTEGLTELFAAPAHASARPS